MDLKLKVLLGKNAGQLLPVPGPKFFVGRAEDCQLRPKSDLVSRHHCVLMVEESFAAVRDFGSRNGTLVNGERVVGERELTSGDRLVIGALEFEVVLSETPAVTKRPRVNSIKEAAARTVAGPLQPAGDASQWLQDGDSSGGETIADTAALTLDQTEQIAVPPTTRPPTIVSPPAAPLSPANVPAPASPASMAETVHPGVAASETVVPPAAPVASAPVAPTQPVAPLTPAQPVAAAPAVPQPSAPATSAAQAPVTPPAAAAPSVALTPAPAATSAPSPSEPVQRAEPPEPATPPPNYYVPPDHEPSEEATDAELEQDQESAGGKKGKKKPGKLPPVSKLNGEDSREAAADTLRKFFQRR